LAWNEAITLAASKLNAASGEEIVGVIGEQSDVESIVALKDLLNRFDSDNFEIRGQVFIDNFIINRAFLNYQQTLEPVI
jgi:hypothetical protein